MTEQALVAINLEDTNLIGAGPLALEWTMGDKGVDFDFGDEVSRVELHDALPPEPLIDTSTEALCGTLHTGLVMTYLVTTFSIALEASNFLCVSSCQCPPKGEGELLVSYVGLGVGAIGFTLSVLAGPKVFETTVQNFKDHKWSTFRKTT